MFQSIEPPTKTAFGLYEVDLQTGELWKAGRRIKLQTQPFKVLAALLERPGEIVTRDELQLRVWGPDTTVDFDHSIGTAVNKIREALGDSADNPRFVETLARRGYRFIAPVTHPSASLSATAPAAGGTPGFGGVPDAALDLAAPAAVATTTPVLQPQALPSHRTTRIAAAIFLGLVVAAAIGYYAGRSNVADGPI